MLFLFVINKYYVHICNAKQMLEITTRERG